MYSLENAEKFNWSSVTGELISERISHLEKYLLGKRILDAGCAGGAYVEFLAKQGMNVTGIDIHRDFLEFAEERSASGTYVEADVTNLPFPDNFFDSTYCFDVLEHVDDRIALSEIARVTSSRIILAVPHEENNLKEFGLMLTTYQDQTHLRYYSEKSLQDLCDSINPLRTSIFYEGYLPCALIIEYLIGKSRTEIPEKFNSRNSFSKKPRISLEKIYRLIVLKLLKRIKYKDVCMGLVAVIDLNK